MMFGGQREEEEEGCAELSGQRKCKVAAVLEAAAIMTTPASKARTRYGRPEAGSSVVSDVRDSPPSKGGDRSDGRRRGVLRRR